jgi:thiosulfate/3-mercaptopyruvate sulfurtransferase
MSRSILISPDELAEALAFDTPPVVLDVRWRLDRPDGWPDYLEAHIPRAVYVDLDHELAEHGDPRDGRHPLPHIEALQASARRWGINDGDWVVVYDNLKNLSSARAWWLLRHAGIEDVRLLDGSLQGWTSAGHPLESGEVTPDAGNVSLAYGGLPVIDIDDAGSFPEHGTLLDARAGERYRGESEPIDPRAGHIPGALSAPTSENVDEHGRFLSPAALRQRFRSIGLADDAHVAAYCGSGVTAAHEIAALTLAGYEAVLYPGSWSQWSNHPERAVAVGPQP